MKLHTIAQTLGCALDNEFHTIEISKVSAIEEADESSITFIADQKLVPSLEQSKARCVIVKKGKAIAGKISLEVADPYVGFALVAQLFEDRSPLFDGPVHPTALIDPSAVIHPTVFIGPMSVIGKHCRIDAGTSIGARCVIENHTAIGENCHIDSGVVVRHHVVIGNRAIIQSGAIIGSDGFGNAWDGQRYVRIPQLGTVVIQDDVDIGANATIDRGALGNTIIRQGVKIDNLVHLAHNVEVGEHSAIAAQTGVSGSTKIGKRVRIGGQAGFVGHITIGDDSMVGAQSGVSKNVEPKTIVAGYPARELMKMRRVEAAMLELPAMAKEVKRLRQDLEVVRAQGFVPQPKS